MTKKEQIKIEMINIEELIPYDKNAKKHDETQIDKLANNIKELGFDQPFVVDKNNVIIKGHGRRLACLKLGIKKVPVVVRRDLTEEQAIAARLSDNRVVSTMYDLDLMQEELKLVSKDLDMMLLGFDAKELEFALGDIEIEIEDAFSEDVGVEVVEQEAEAKDENVESIKIAKAFPFKEIPEASMFTLQQFLNLAEARYGEGAAGFVKLIEESLGKIQ